MRKNLSIFLTAVLVSLVAVSCASGAKAAGPVNDEIVILYENDVHCGVDGYAGFAALKKEMQRGHKYVQVVSNGDFVQGGSLGASSKGRDIINIMNETGYDFVTLGNHEFDYGIPRQQELLDALDAVCLCCNFKDLRTGGQIYDAYKVVDFGEVKIGFIGMSTPYTINSSTPSYFKDENGNYIYSFCISEFYETVQKAVDDARGEGADYIVVLSHLGDVSEGENSITSLSMIAGTNGIDVVLDGHSHSVIEAEYPTNKDGGKVLLTSTGTKFQNYGVLTFKNGTFRSELIPSAGYKESDSWVKKVVDNIKEGYKKVAEEVIFTSEVKLRSYDDSRNRLVRSEETNLGDFCTDAYRTVFDTDIAMLGGGSIREDLPKGEVTFNDLYTMFPFENGSCKAKISGSLLLDVLEASVSICPEDFGGFQQISGLIFEVDTTIPSPVRYDGNHNFIGVEGARRVRNVKVLDKSTGQYTALDTKKNYSIAASSYLIIEGGDGYTMMEQCTDIQDTGMLDTDVIQTYVTNYLGNRIGKEYAEPQGRIRILE